VRRIHLVNALLLAALFVGAALAWPELPERIPAHVSAAGRVTRWNSPTFPSWFGLPLLTLGIVGINYLLAWMLPRRPHLLNFPDRERFLALPPERQAPVIERARDLIYGLTALVVVLMGMVQWMMFRTAHGAPAEMSTLGILLVSFLMGPLAMVTWLPRLQAEMRRQIREQQAEEGGRPA
jgi:hypothetical protein